MILKIVIAEDELLTRIGIRNLIPWQEHEFQLIGEAENGEQTLKLLEKDPPDILLLDINMPLLDGISVDLPEIRSRWMGCSVCDDIGLVKWFFWERPDGSVGYATEGFPDITSGTLFYRARIKGPLSALPELPGLALWRNGHMGIYIGRGALVEAKDAGSGVVQSCLSDRDFTHWFKIPGLYYLSI